MDPLLGAIQDIQYSKFEKHHHVRNYVPNGVRVFPGKTSMPEPRTKKQTNSNGKEKVKKNVQHEWRIGRYIKTYTKIMMR